MVHKESRASKTVLATAVAALALGGAGMSSASAATVSDPIVEGLAGPLQIDVGFYGQVYVGQSFAGLLTKVRPNGSTKTLVSAPGTEISGVASSGYTVTYTTSGKGADGNPYQQLRRRTSDGQVRTLAYLGRYERRHNPDAVRSYGFRDLSNDCADQVPPQIGGHPYSGRIDSHPYAVALPGNGASLVADAAGNDILRVGPHGRVTTVAVLPPVPAKVTADAAATLGLPDCVVGHTYYFEAVPTDVEVGPGGWLYVSELPGGPEDPSLGARGAVVRIDPTTGAVQRLAKGFLGATNLAVTPTGRIFVTELFGNRIATVKDGKAVPFVDLDQPAALEWARGKLYASSGALSNGSIVTITP